MFIFLSAQRSLVARQEKRRAVRNLRRHGRDLITALWRGVLSPGRWLGGVIKALAGCSPAAIAQMVGSCNPKFNKLSFGILHKSNVPIYRLDLGKDHRNPNQHLIGRKHKHKWSAQYRDKDAYAPDDITADASDPIAVWKQFCAEAKVVHNGQMFAPVLPPEQFGLKGLHSP